MIERKPHKFSLNSSEKNGLNIPKEDSSSFFSQQRNKTAAETATSILEELGINKSSENESVKPKAGNKVPDKPAKIGPRNRIVVTNGANLKIDF